MRKKGKWEKVEKGKKKKREEGKYGNMQHCSKSTKGASCCLF